jgi:hypothetical protein
VTTVVTNWPDCPEPKTVVQPPDTTNEGLDVLASWPTLLADDFLCTDAGLITNITVWGSWSNDLDNANASFLIGLWTDVPSAQGQPSHPGRLLQSHWFVPGEYTIAGVALANEQFYDPNTDQIVAPDTQMWRYEFASTNIYWQIGTPDRPRIYWLSVMADTTGELFGWKTSRTHFQDAAVFGHVDTNGVILSDWEPMFDPSSGNPMDLAFAIATDNRRPIITDVALANNSVILTWSACPGRVYRLEYRFNVEGPGWTVLPGDVLALGTRASRSDLMIPDRRFYRVRLLP